MSEHSLFDRRAITQWRCKIGRVRPKDGSAVIERLPQPDDEWVVGEVRKAAEEAYSGLDVIRGAVVVFWDRTGTTRTAIYQDAGCSLPYSVLPSFAHDALLVHVTAQTLRRK